MSSKLHSGFICVQAVCGPPLFAMVYRVSYRVGSQVLNNNLLPDCIRSNLRGSKFSWGAYPQTPPSLHARLCVHECAFTHYYLPATILFSPRNSKSCMKPWFRVTFFVQQAKLELGCKWNSFGSSIFLPKRGGTVIYLCIIGWTLKIFMHYR